MRAAWQLSSHALERLRLARLPHLLAPAFAVNALAAQSGCNHKPALCLAAPLAGGHLRT